MNEFVAIYEYTKLTVCFTCESNDVTKHTSEQSFYAYIFCLMVSRYNNLAFYSRIPGHQVQ